MKYKISAVIPVAQFANLQPSIEIEAETFEAAQARVMPHIEKLWAQYGEKPLVSVQPNATKRLEAYIGGEIDYDEVNHIYSWNGEVYQSGSQYAKQFEKPFDAQAIAKKMATKYKVSPDEIATMWQLKARTSREFGTALHSALELYGRFSALATALERDTALHDHPVIKKAVQAFYKGREAEEAEYEVLVVDHKNKRAGRIDRLLRTSGELKGGLVEPLFQVQDFKCNAIIDKAKLAVYWKQLEFYSGILEANHIKTRPPVIFHYDGTWHEYNKEVK